MVEEEAVAAATVASSAATAAAVVRLKQFVKQPLAKHDVILCVCWWLRLEVV